MKKLLYLGALGLIMVAVACQMPSTGLGESDQSALILSKSATPSSTDAASQPISGAIFTTTPDGSIVNENVRYESKLEVYLDGGPGPNAPQTAAGLPDGRYIFQVTDPSGKVLLSEDPAKCRVVEVADGVIVRLVKPTEFELGPGYEILLNGGKTEWVEYCHIQDDPDGEAGSSGRHDTNTDADHGPPAIVVQLMPFFDTPNPGGVYKAWMIPFDRYEDNGGELEKVPVNFPQKVKNKTIGFERDPGFGPSQKDIKTDNFKVKRKGPQVEPPLIVVKKFHDANFNGEFDEGQDEWITGWEVSITDPFGNIASPLYTEVEYLAAEAGTYTVEEATPAGTIQTVSILDGSQVSFYPGADPTVAVDVVANYSPKNPQEVHTVIYGNVGTGEVTARKYYDRNGNGLVDINEPPIEGWKFELSGVLANGGGLDPFYGLTGADGSVAFTGLLPGFYTITELMAEGYVASGSESFEFSITSTLIGTSLSGGFYTFDFTNYCEGLADFDTKGYWHNKNGLIELTESPDEDETRIPDVIELVNSLPPYANISPYFDAGDEPFDGLFENGPVDAMFGDGEFQGVEVAVEGTWQAEVSQFLVDRNAGSSEFNNKEQLAQQLLAFIFNSYFRLDSPNAAVLVDGEWVSASSLINQAIDVWEDGSSEEVVAMQELIAGFNEADPPYPGTLVAFIHYYPCPVVYQ